MKKHLKFVLFLGAMVLIAAIIFNLKKEADYAKEEAVENMAAKEFLGIKLLDIFLGVIGLAFVGITACYVVSLVKGGGKREAVALEGEASAEAAVTEQPPRKKLALEKALGRKGARIFGAAVVTVLILVVVAMVVLVAFLLFPGKLKFLQSLFERLGEGSIF